MTKTPNPLRRAVPRCLAAIGWMCLIFLVSARSTVPRAPGLGPVLTSMLGHFSVYFVLAMVLWWMFGGFGLEGRRRSLLAFGLAVLYGVTDEWHQSFVPGRTPDALDVLVDAIGAASGLYVAGWVSARWNWTLRWSISSERPLLGR